MSQSSGRAAVAPFVVDIPDADVDDLRARLRRTRWAPEIPGAGWDRGVPADYLRDLVSYWADGFDWRAAEADLNRWPQFTGSYEGQTIYFKHVSTAGPDALPLLLLHDNPGGIAHFLDVIEPLSQRYRLVVPSMPGFGFSSPLTSVGWTVPRTAAAFLSVMSDLGYERFGIQGGGGGANVAMEMARQAPDRVIGVHVNAWVPFPDDNVADLTDVEQARMATVQRFMQDGFGFNIIMTTRPQTIGYGLNDSPAAALAWVVEKFKEWSAPGNQTPDDAFSRERMLVDASVQWFTQTSGTIAQTYYDVGHDPGAWGPKDRVRVPVGVAVSAGDVTIRRFADRDATITRWTEFDHSGAYLALERPDALVADVTAFFDGLGS